MNVKIKYLGIDGVAEPGFTIGKEYFVLGFIWPNYGGLHGIVVDDNDSLRNTSTPGGITNEAGHWQLISATVEVERKLA